MELKIIIKKVFLKLHFQALSVSFVNGESLAGSFFLNKGLGVDFGVAHTQGWPSHLLADSTHRGQLGSKSVSEISQHRSSSEDVPTEKESDPVKTFDRCYFEKWESSQTGSCTAWGACRFGANVHLDADCNNDNIGAHCRSLGGCWGRI